MLKLFTVILLNKNSVYFIMMPSLLPVGFVANVFSLSDFTFKFVITFILFKGKVPVCRSHRATCKSWFSPPPCVCMQHVSRYQVFLFFFPRIVYLALFQFYCL